MEMLILIVPIFVALSSTHICK